MGGIWHSLSSKNCKTLFFQIIYLHHIEFKMNVLERSVVHNKNSRVWLICNCGSIKKRCVMYYKKLLLGKGKTWVHKHTFITLPMHTTKTSTTPMHVIMQKLLMDMMQFQLCFVELMFHLQNCHIISFKDPHNKSWQKGCWTNFHWSKQKCTSP